jgi:hypothetical protein
MLTRERVETIIKDCLYGAPEGPGSVIIEGVVRTFVLDKAKLESHKDEIVTMLRELPETFFRGTGDGYTFLNLCMTKHGQQWGEQPDCEALCVLAFGIGVGAWVMPRNMWSILPGSVPYVCFDLTDKVLA